MDTTRSIVVIRVQICQTETIIVIPLVRPMGYVVKYKVRKIAKSLLKHQLLSNFIDANHQNSCLFTNKGHFQSPLWGLIGVLAKFLE